MNYVQLYILYLYTITYACILSTVRYMYINLQMCKCIYALLIFLNAVGVKKKLTVSVTVMDVDSVTVSGRWLV